MTPEARQPIGKETAVQLGLVVVVIGAVAFCSRWMGTLETQQEADRARIQRLEDGRKDDGGTLREVRDLVLRLNEQMGALRRELDDTKGLRLLPARGER